MRISNKFFCLIILSIFINYNLCGEFDVIPEISSEELAEYQAKYVQESDPSERKYLEPVIKPQNFDLNKDRKISMEELKEALIYVMMPNDKRKYKVVPQEIKDNINNNIDLFIKHVNKRSLTFGQFAYLMRTVSLTQFWNFESLKNQLQAKDEQRTEGEGEL
jgi:hypothetical protein